MASKSSKALQRLSASERASKTSESAFETFFEMGIFNLRTLCEAAMAGLCDSINGTLHARNVDTKMATEIGH